MWGAHPAELRLRFAAHPAVRRLPAGRRAGKPPRGLHRRAPVGATSGRPRMIHGLNHQLACPPRRCSTCCAISTATCWVWRSGRPGLRHPGYCCTPAASLCCTWPSRRRMRHCARQRQRPASSTTPRSPPSDLMPRPCLRQHGVAFEVSRSRADAPAPVLLRPRQRHRTLPLRPPTSGLNHARHPTRTRRQAPGPKRIAAQHAKGKLTAPRAPGAAV